VVVCDSARQSKGVRNQPILFIQNMEVTETIMRTPFFPGFAMRVGNRRAWLDVISHTANLNQIRTDHRCRF